MTLIRLTFLCLLCVGMVGCSRNSDGKIAVTGNVTFQGEPVELGSITFMPVDGTGTTNGGEIVNGHFEVRVSPGEQAVQIYANRPDPKRKLSKEMEERGVDPPTEQYIPEKYNRKSTLRVTISKENKQSDFDLTM